jgi:PIN domain nuclease of toxin-antitoxin system
MILVDTCVLIFDSLSPERLTHAAKAQLDEGTNRALLACSDISLWEIAMLLQKRRFSIPCDARTYLNALLDSRSYTVLPISAEIATLSTELEMHGDPADRLIAATSIHFDAPLLTSDQKLRAHPAIRTIW